MEIKYLKNDYLTIGIKQLGAELASIVNNSNGNEYLWQASPEFWKRHSPVLFPIVGSVWNGEFRHQGISYPMSQHGFARDSNFELISKSETEVFYRLESNDETLKKYPFPFILEIGYRLNDSVIDVIWRVKNKGSEPMHFQIGAHPAFNYRDFDAANNLRGYFSFDKNENLKYNLITEKGCVEANAAYPLTLEDGLLPIERDTFEKDALIFENSQLKAVSLLDKAKKTYLTLRFEAPLVGLWSMSDKAPFVCIEPWYGRCDRVGFTGEYKDRDWVNTLEGNEIFEASYQIEINN